MLGCHRTFLAFLIWLRSMVSSVDSALVWMLCAKHPLSRLHYLLRLKLRSRLCKLGKGVLHYWLGSAFWLSCAKPGSFMSNLLHGSLRIDLHREERLYIVEYWIPLLLFSNSND